MRTDILERKDEILTWISEELTLYEIKSRLGCKYETLRRYLKKMGINYAGQQCRKGQYKGGKRFNSIEEYIANARSIKSNELKRKLIYFGVKEARCEICKLYTWNDLPIPLELHHIDGNHYNNELSNLQIICPNCHAQQSNNSGSAIGSYTTRKISYKKKLTDRRSKIAENKAKGLINDSERTDSLGRINDRILSETDWQDRKDLILNSGVNLKKFGWKTEVQDATGLTRRQVDLTVEHFRDEFTSIIYIRK